MANVNLSEYIQTLKLDPHTVNTGKWWARSTVQHNAKSYAPGVQLPFDGDEALTNGDVAQLLEVNALTSVGPKTEESTAQVESGTTHVDENGNTVDENGNIVTPAE